MRSNKRDYYATLLEDNRSNIRNTWKVLNIKNNQGKTGDPYYFLTKNNTAVKDITLSAN